MSCVFCDIINKQIQSNILFEDASFILIKDIKPDAKIHLLAIPKGHFDNLCDAKAQDFEVIRNIFIFISENAHKYGLIDGYRIIMNNGLYATQTVYHCHIHILGGQQLKHPQKHLTE
ncbi:HIT domain-containing protein [Dysgonomonas sp. 521]|uniref:HIT domain-containing protein n=1 Tax=Dysgonomonas sp. 521 TaxID=2302932 RepID=UPI0013D27F73|nr:HIT domain-containing protein [Dysgonomonas sp. 521]NDV96416.1 HIT domain-containing protein [Dysgonomonas sp. 521]